MSLLACGRVSATARSIEIMASTHFCGSAESNTKYILCEYRDLGEQRRRTYLLLRRIHDINELPLLEAITTEKLGIFINFSTDWASRCTLEG